MNAVTERLNCAGGWQRPVHTAHASHAIAVRNLLYPGNTVAVAEQKCRVDCYPLTLRKKSKAKITIQTTVATAHAMPEIAPKRSRIGLHHNTKRVGE